MKKLLAAAVCAAALVGCGGPIDENDPAYASDQQQLVQPDGVPGTPAVDPNALKLNGAQDQVQQQRADFADSYVWGVTGKPHHGHCGK